MVDLLFKIVGYGLMAVIALGTLSLFVDALKTSLRR